MVMLVAVVADALFFKLPVLGLDAGRHTLPLFHVRSMLSLRMAPPLSFLRFTSFFLPATSQSK